MQATVKRTTAALSILIAIAFCFYHAHVKDVSNYYEMISLIRRALDPAYVSRDFAINSNFPFGPRAYYVSVMASLNGLWDLSIVFFYTRAFIYLLIAYLTFSLASSLFKVYVFAPVIA